MPPTNTDEGIVGAAASCAAEQPGIGVVLLSQHVEVDVRGAASSNGGSARRAYLLKERVGDATELVNAIRTVAAGGSVIDPMVVEQLVAGRTSARPAAPSTGSARASARCWARWRWARTTRPSPPTLFLTERAVEKHTNAIFAKLGFTEEPDLNRRVAAVLIYLQQCSLTWCQYPFRSAYPLTSQYVSPGADSIHDHSDGGLRSAGRRRCDAGVARRRRRRPAAVPRRAAPDAALAPTTSRWWARPPTAPRPCSSSNSSPPTSSCSTCACPAWTGRCGRDHREAVAGRRSGPLEPRRRTTCPTVSRPPREESLTASVIRLVARRD